MKLSENNTVYVTVIQDNGLFYLNALYDHNKGMWCNDISVCTFPNTTEEEIIRNHDWAKQLYLALKAQMDFEERKIGCTNENEYVQWWFETFSTKGNIFEISNDFIDAYEDLQKIIGNEE